MNTPAIIGRQSFDGLGRQLRVEAAGYITHYHYNNDQLPPAANTLSDGIRVEFTYEKALNNRLLSVTPQGEPTQSITYHPMGMPASASGVLGTEAFGFTASGQPEQDSWTVDGTRHDTHWQYSMAGLLQGFTDPQGRSHQRTLDAHGRVEETRVGDVTTQYRYDGLSRPVRIIVSESGSGRTLTTSLTYDACGREHMRTFQIATAADGITRTFSQTLAYSALDQITSRLWAEGDDQCEETFEYDIRGRLIHYTADAAAAPQDPFGNPIVGQVFTFNALNGHERVITTFADGSEDDAHFTYARNNPVQLVKVSHTHPSWPAEVTLHYDACGRVVGDSLGREMVWNAQDRLTEVRHDHRRCEYGYTAHGRLADRVVDGALTRSFFSGDELTHDQSGSDSVQYCAGEQGLFAVNKLTGGIRQTTLLGSDAQGSVRLEADSAVRTRRYSAYGIEPHDEAHMPFGYAGQRSEPLTGWQILGDYRPYDPVLMCFLSPDSESPFGSGGINPYGYCSGDPVNRIDPDGHNWVNYALAGVGLAIGVAATIASVGAVAGIIAAGASALTPSALLTLSAFALDVVSLSTGVASLALEMRGADENAANVLGWVSLGTGIASAGLLAARGLGKATSRVGDRPKSAMSAGYPSKAESYIGDTHILHSKGSQVEVAYHERLWGQDLRAFETHGGSDGSLMNALGGYEQAAIVARRELAPRLLDYAKGRPLVLLACEGGSSGAAQQIANVLKRPVIGYDKVIYVSPPRNLAKAPYYQLGGNDIWTNVPTHKISFLKRFAQRNAPTVHGNKYRELATYQTYLPQ